MREQIAAYAIPIGDTVFYLHAACFAQAEERNVNHLDQKTMERARACYTPLRLADVPADAVCSYLYCWKRIAEHEEWTIP